MQEANEKRSLRDWQMASRLTRNAFAKELKIDPRVLKSAMDGEPIHEIKALIIVDGIRSYFERSVESEKLPSSPEDIEGIVIYNPEVHRRSTAGIPQKRKSS